MARLSGSGSTESIGGWAAVLRSGIRSSLPRVRLAQARRSLRLVAAAKTAIMREVLQTPMTRKAPRPRASVLSFLRLPNQPSTLERRLNALIQLGRDSGARSCVGRRRVATDRP